MPIDIMPKGDMPNECVPKRQMPFYWIPIYCSASILQRVQTIGFLLKQVSTMLLSSFVFINKRNMMYSGS